MATRGWSIEEVAEALRRGEPAIFPTDTVVGLGVAVAACPSPQVLFDVKHRPAGKPVAWLAADLDALDEYGSDVPQEARDLVAGGWPGALTVIVKASELVPAPYRSQFGTIGLRVPANEVVRELIRAVGCPIATTSANMSGAQPPCRTSALDPQLVRVVPAVLESSESGSGMPSTVIDFSRETPIQLR